MKIVIDIFDEKDFIYNFIKDYKLPYSDIYLDIFKNFFEQNELEKFNLPKNYTLQSSDFDNVLINDIINISYMPYSQKYVDLYENTVGKVFYLSKINNNGLIYYDIEDNGNIIRIIKSFKKEYCSYYGDTPGYCTLIEKIKIN